MSVSGLLDICLDGALNKLNTRIGSEELKLCTDSNQGETSYSTILIDLLDSLFRDKVEM